MHNDDKETKAKWRKIADEIEKDTETDGDAKQNEYAQGTEGDEDGENGGLDEPAELEHPSYKALEDKLTDAEIKAHENWDKAMRAVAELENVRRRSERDIANAHRYSIEKFATQLLPVIDSLEQALQEEPGKKESSDHMRHGIELTLRLLNDALKKFSIEQLDPLGDAFDPNFHEAMATQMNNEVKSGTVLTVFQKGYILHDRVLRPARVIVSKEG